MDDMEQDVVVQNQNTESQSPNNPAEENTSNIIDEQYLKQLYIITISRILNQMTNESPQELDEESLTEFDLNQAPGINISTYMNII